MTRTAGLPALVPASMPSVTLISSSGVCRHIDIPDGETLMRAARHHGVEEILGECGGACCCATCHVYLDQAWAARVPAPDEHERRVLEFVAAPLRDGSRLACQIVVHAGADGLVATLPDTQI